MDMLADPGAAFAAIVEAAPAGVLIADGEGRILYANEALARMFGYQAGALEGRALETLLPPRYRGAHAGLRAGFMAAPRPRAMGEGKPLFALHADGHEFAIEIGLGTLRHQGTRSAVAIISDVSVREERERSFTTLFHALPFGLLVTDAGGRITMVNSVLERMFGYAPGELAGQLVETLLPVQLRAAHPGQRSAYLKAPSVRAMGSGRDLMARHKSGGEFPVEVALTPIQGPDGLHAVAAVTDISVRKRHESALLQMNAQLEEFTYIASHDLRSPLRGIADLLTWIQEDLGEALLSDGIRNNFERAHLRVARAEQMIEDLLEYARSGQHDGRIALIDARRLVDEVVAMLPPPPHLHVEVDIEGAPFRTAVTPLAMALRNLLANAYKHHGGTQGRVRIAMREVGPVNLFTVEDDGAGVPPGAEERIFKLFQRSSNNTPGHGVGLAVTKRAVNAYGGTIELSREGRLGGACFRIHWPRHPKQEID